MKRILALGVCLLLCAALFCGCDGARGNDVSVDINAPIHTLDEFKNGDVSCFVTVEKAKEPTATGAESVAETETVTATYTFKGQEAVDLYNLMNRTGWKTVDTADQPTGTYAQMLTLDFYGGRSLENATAYYGTVTISNQDRIIASASPNDLALSMAQAAKGTYDALWSYITEKGEEDE